MLYFLSAYFHIFKYQTFRGIGSVLTAFLIGFLIAPPMIKLLKQLQKDGQPIRSDGPQSHIISKSGTPTMGGVMMIFSVFITTLLWAQLSNPLIGVALLMMICFGALGFLDDYQKLKYKSSKGISARHKFLLQWFLALLISAIAMFIIGHDQFNVLYVPIFKNLFFNLSYFYLFWSAFVIVGSSNAVNLTDGLDGLAVFPIMISSFVLAVISYAVGHQIFAGYLFLPYVPCAGELVIFLGSWIGASLAFLWFNAPPAKIFMGDTGSLAAGASLGFIAILVKHELVWAIIGGVFVVEALSVTLQVLSYKLRKKRVLKMAPIHHHFEHCGWSEPTIVIRFWIISVILALIGLAFLKIR